MKKALASIICMLLSAGLLSSCTGSSIPVSAVNAAKQNVIRLHILANSDSDADQSLKLDVRDLVLKDWGGKLAAAGTAQAAWKLLNELLPSIKDGITEYLGGRKAGYGVTLETGVYEFPSKNYNGVAFPAGNYQALKIELGSGAGHNWWCVMFPPLCLVGDGGDMDMQQYTDLVKALEDEGVTPDTAPDAPVHSWLYDQIFGDAKWNDIFMQWAKEYWVGGDGQ